ncbi:uncharacterized protein LOC106753574 [Vigna radiata var. radiata]|uniref:Uncharacterized protein LOC106753574 n=1 Tax=Vigna radiata var. radiata TaxID=3916 RepID=A0A3Q0ESA0_VIGRR|nr:uncharacterized protein LOC106753574 [Vigna radiata var. radiata]
MLARSQLFGATKREVGKVRKSGGRRKGLKRLRSRTLHPKQYWLRVRLPPRLPARRHWSEEQAVAVGGEKSQIYRSEGPASALKDPSSIPNVSEAIASLSSTVEANSLREKRRCSFAPRLHRGQSSEPPCLRWRKSRRVRRFGLYLCYPNLLSFLFKTKRPKALRYVVVTEANKGIGFAICKQLASNGFIVVFTARDEKRGVEAVEKLKELGLPGHVVFHQLDVIDPKSITSLVDFIKNQYGKLDILRKVVVGCWLNEICRGKFDVSFGCWLHLT